MLSFDTTGGATAALIVKEDFGTTALIVCVSFVLLMMAGYALLFATLWMIRIRTAILERRARGLMQGLA